MPLPKNPYHGNVKRRVVPHMTKRIKHCVKSPEVILLDTHKNQLAFASTSMWE